MSLLSESLLSESVLSTRCRPDRRAGFVLITVFVLGILGASVAAVINGGNPQRSVEATVQLTKLIGPM
jgi:hypothetical protein